MKGLKIKFKVLNRIWKLRLMTRKKYEKKHGNDSVAITVTHKRRIDALPEGFDVETMTHEVVHAFISELCIHVTTLSHENFEELTAELIAKRGHEILSLGKELSKKACRLGGKTK